MKVQLYLTEEKRYSDMREHYFMYPNFLYDEGEFIDVSINAKFAFGYMIRKANKQNRENGKQDIIYFSTNELASKCGFSPSTAKKVTKELIEKEWIRKISTGSNLTGRANTYRLLYPYPTYEEGVEVDINIVERELSYEEIDKMLAKGNGKIYYYEEDGVFSHRKRLPVLVDTDTGEVGVSVLNYAQVG